MLRKNRSFAKMFAAYGLSAFGDYFDFMAVTILLGFIWKEDAMTIAMLPLCFAVPGIAFSQLAGILADRWNKRNLMIATDLLRSGLTVMLIFAPNAGVLLGLIAIRSTARVFHFPAQQSMTRAVVEPDQLLQATSINGAVFQLSKILGPLLGASAASAFSPSVSMAVNAVCYVVSAFLLLLVPAMDGRRVPVAASVTGKKGSLRGEWRDGWRLLWHSRTLRMSLLFSLIGLAGIQMIDAQFAVLFREIAPEQPDLMGWLVTAIGAGGLASVTWLRRYQEFTRYGWLLGGGVALIGLMFAAAGAFRQDSTLWLMLLVFFIGGIGTGFTSSGMNYILQKETPPEAVGRVSGIFDSLSSVIFVIAPLSGGALIGLMGASRTFLTVGLAVGIIGFVGIVLRRQIWGISDTRKSEVSHNA
ncbi:MFS transporter [Paenibacillus sp. MMO-58]|uniref:MFS transporter n=1 Tax=Paenibacillus sp. MMO-58 TaxID=3081290 RepID=UPI003019766D